MKKEEITPDNASLQVNDSQNSRKPWEPMRLVYTGEAKDVVRGGTGKFSTTQSDPGDAKKPTGQG